MDFDEQLRFECDRSIKIYKSLHKSMGIMRLDDLVVRLINLLAQKARFHHDCRWLAMDLAMQFTQRAKQLTLDDIDIGAILYASYLISENQKTTSHEQFLERTKLKVSEEAFAKRLSIILVTLDFCLPVYPAPQFNAALLIWSHLVELSGMGGVSARNGVRLLQYVLDLSSGYCRAIQQPPVHAIILAACAVHTALQLSCREGQQLSDDMIPWLAATVHTSPEYLQEHADKFHAIVLHIVEDNQLE